MRAGRSIGLAAALCLTVLAAAPDTPFARSQSDGQLYAQGKVARCLARNKVSEESDASFKVVKPSYRKLFPSGIIGSMSVPAPGASSGRFDHVLLFFFRTDQLAQQGRARLVSTFYYERGVPLAIAFILQIHGVPAGAEVSKLNRTVGNVVVLWEYPRHHPVKSDRLLDVCLASSPR